MAEDKLNEMLKGKYVLFIPVYSMRSYKTGKYNLTKDGNFMRVLSKAMSCGCAHAQILLPTADKIDDVVEMTSMLRELGITKNCKVRTPMIGNYGCSALETRESTTLLDESLRYLIQQADVIVSEPQVTTKQIFDEYNLSDCELIYWTVASVSEQGTPWFVKKFKRADRELACLMPTACVSQGQVTALGGKSFLTSFYNPSLTDEEIIFFPFRLSDPSYRADFMAYIVRRLSRETQNCFKVFVTDPNDASRTNDIAADLLRCPNVKKIPSDHDILTAILKGKPTIPCFEQLDTVRHISTEEMVYYGCNFICPVNETYKGHSNVHMFSNDKEAYAMVKNAVERKR